jgi:hypothetical protein
MDIYVPSTPAHLKITQTMVEDFIIDPVLGVKVIFGYKMDAFQRARMKICWWTPRVMDSSGFSSAKTINMWFVSNLRALLLPDHVVGVYYPNFDSGKRIYWLYFREVAQHSKLYAAQCGKERVDGIDGKSNEVGKAMDKGPSCYVFEYRNGSRIMMPAPGFMQGAKSQAGMRFNDLDVDEWTKIEAGKGEGIDDQLVGRTTRACHNKLHPVFRNHHLFLATAEDTMHPAYPRYHKFLQEVKEGNPDYYVFSFCFKDYSNAPFDSTQTFKDRFREDQVIKDLRKKGRAGFLQEALGVWSNNGRGWYTSETIRHCYEVGERNEAKVYLSRQEDPQGSKAHYFVGVDPARSETKKADDGAIVTLRAVPLIAESAQEIEGYDLSWCYARRVRKADAKQWSGIIHGIHQAFSLTGICMDPGGGGTWIQPELKKTEQIINGVSRTVRPIASLEDEEGMAVVGDWILSMFRPRDLRVKQTWPNLDALKWEKLIETGHFELRAGLEYGIGFPKPLSMLPSEEVKGFSKEKIWATNILSHPREGMGAQLMKIFVLTDQTGAALLTKSAGALRFSSKSDKDFAYAGMYAYASFLMWLRSGELDVSVPDEDADMCVGSSANYCM